MYKGVWNGTEVGNTARFLRSLYLGVKFLTSPSMNEQFLNDFYKEVNIMRFGSNSFDMIMLEHCVTPMFCNFWVLALIHPMFAL